jgi:hypothetical protein
MVTLVYRSDPLTAALIRYTTGAITLITLGIIITTIIHTATGTGATTVIGTTGTTMMIRPKRFSSPRLDSSVAPSELGRFLSVTWGSASLHPRLSSVRAFGASEQVSQVKILSVAHLGVALREA